ncbi:MAG: hypothetical protein IPM82_15585 [Saprospiraceae bacterium]|nr:hypothetical protein [Saprospiraceae bacterium]
MADLILEITKLSIADRIKLVQEILGTVASDIENQQVILDNIYDEPDTDSFVEMMLKEGEADIKAGRTYSSEEAIKSLKQKIEEHRS